MRLLPRKKRLKGKVGLALGSGAARGWAHIGVIKALSEKNIKIDYVAGTSIGALVGAVFASGKLLALEDIIIKLDWKQIAYFFDIKIPRSGLIDGKKITNFIRSHINKRMIEDLPIPFCAVTTDIQTGNEIIINSGDIIEAVRASISVPGIFTPMKKDDMILVDGGLVNPVPISVVRNMGADYVIAVDLNHNLIHKNNLKKDKSLNTKNYQPVKKIDKSEKNNNGIFEMLNQKITDSELPGWGYLKKWMNKEPLPSIFEILTYSINIMSTQITTTRLKVDAPDILIQPELGHIKFLDFNRGKEAIECGYMAAKKAIDNIKI